MNLGNPTLERLLRRRIRAEVNAVPAWRGARRRAKKLGKERSLPWSFRLLMIPIFLVVYLVPSAHDWQMLLALGTVWMIGSVFLQTSKLLGWIYNPAHFKVFAHLPAPMDLMFRHQWGGFLRQSLWSWFDFFLLFTLLARGADFGAYAPLIGFAFGCFQWMIIAALATLLAVVRPTGRYSWIGSWICLMVLPLIFFGDQLPSFIQSLAALGQWIPPMGLLLYSFGINPGAGAALWSGACSGLLLVGFPRMRRRLQDVFNRYVAWVELGHPPVQVEPASSVEAMAEGRSRVAGGAWLNGLNWERAGMMERMSLPLFCLRERALAEFLEGGELDWTSSLKRIAAGFGIALGVLVIFSAFGGVIMIAACYFALGTIPAISGWAGLQSVQMFGQGSPMYAGFPIGYWEMARVILKISLVRLLAAAPMITAFLCLGFWLQKNDPMLGLSWALKGLALLLVCLPAGIAVRVSLKTTDHFKKRWTVPFAVAAVLLVSTALMVFTLFLMVPWDLWIWVVVLGVAGGVSGFIFWVYGVLFHRGQVDLIHRETDL